MPELTNEEVDRIINAELQLALSGKLDDSVPATTDEADRSLIPEEVGKHVYAYLEEGCWRLANEEMVKKAQGGEQFVMARDLVGIYYAINQKYGVDGDTLTKFRTVDNKSFLHRIKYMQSKMTEEGLGDFYAGFEKFCTGRLRGSWGYYDNNLQITQKPAVATDISFSELLDHVEKHKEVYVDNSLSPKLASYLGDLYRMENKSDDSYSNGSFMLEGFLFSRHYSGTFFVKVLTEKDLRNQAARRKRDKEQAARNAVANHFSRIKNRLSSAVYEQISSRTSWFCRLRISQLRDLLRAAKTLGCRNEVRNCEKYVEAVKEVKPEILAKYKSRSHLNRKLCAFFLAERRRLVKD